MPDPSVAVGRRLRQVRTEQGLSLRELAARVGKSESYLSRIERGQLDLTISTLKVIADQLGRSILSLLDDGSSDSSGLIRAGMHSTLVVSPELRYDVLSTPNPEVSLFRILLKPGADSGRLPYAHEGVEAGVILQGTVRVRVGKQDYVLQKGDSLTHRSSEPHCFENAGKGDAVAIWVVAPPTF